MPKFLAVVKRRLSRLHRLRHLRTGDHDEPRLLFKGMPCRGHLVTALRCFGIATAASGAFGEALLLPPGAPALRLSAILQCLFCYFAVLDNAVVLGLGVMLLLARRLPLWGVAILWAEFPYFLLGVGAIARLHSLGIFSLQEAHTGYQAYRGVMVRTLLLFPLWAYLLWRRPLSDRVPSDQP